MKAVKAAFYFLMKKFIIYILIILGLVIGSHFFFTEVIAPKRPFVMVGSLLLICCSIFGVFRFAKRNIINTKHS